MTSERRWRILTWLSVVVAGGMIAWEGFVHSPNLDEVGHLPAGCLVAGFGRFDLYKVNPPLVKGLAAIPVVLSTPKYDWSQYVTEPGIRNEWTVGRSMIAANGARSFRLFTMARWMLLSLWLIGALIIGCWATERGGPVAGFASTVLWCFSPEVMGWTATICPDSPAASMGVWCLWTFRSWLKDTHWTTAAIAGIVLGLGLLTKTSWIILVPLYPLLAVVHRHGRTWQAGRHLILMGVVALYVINSGYGFDRSFTKLGDFQFFTKTLAGAKEDGSLRQTIPSEAGNRFAGTWLGEIPVPLPASLVEGLDLQKYDFEEGKWSYLRGEHKFGGWWYWYVYALLVKTPVGVLLLGVMVLGCGVWKWVRGRLSSLDNSSTSDAAAPASGLRAPSPPNRGRRDSVTADKSALHEKLILLAPAVCLFVLVSSQTGFSRYLRYVLPCYPFMFIWIGQLFSDRISMPLWLRGGMWGLLGWAVVSSLAVFPHSVSYFNEPAGGPENAAAHLIDASVDWGQDVLFLADWVKEHPEASPLYLSLHVFFDPRIAGIEYQHPPVDAPHAKRREWVTSDDIGPKAGWYAISIHQLHSRSNEFAYLFEFEPVDRIGYSIEIYHLTEANVTAWNEAHGGVPKAETGQ